jgi:hypothetical protein
VAALPPHEDIATRRHVPSEDVGAEPHVEVLGLEPLRAEPNIEELRKTSGRRRRRAGGRRAFRGQGGRRGPSSNVDLRTGCWDRRATFLFVGLLAERQRGPSRRGLLLRSIRPLGYSGHVGVDRVGGLEVAGTPAAMADLKRRISLPARATSRAFALVDSAGDNIAGVRAPAQPTTPGLKSSSW